MDGGNVNGLGAVLVVEFGEVGLSLVLGAWLRKVGATKAPLLCQKRAAIVDGSENATRFGAGLLELLGLERVRALFNFGLLLRRRGGGAFRFYCWLRLESITFCVRRY